MIEALLYMFGPDGAPRKVMAPSGPSANTPTITEADNAAGGRLDVAVSGQVKFHVFNDTVFWAFTSGPSATAVNAAQSPNEVEVDAGLKARGDSE